MLFVETIQKTFLKFVRKVFEKNRYKHVQNPVDNCKSSAIARLNSENSGFDINFRSTDPGLAGLETKCQRIKKMKTRKTAALKLSQVEEKINEYFEKRNAELIAKGGKPRLGPQAVLKDDMLLVMQLVVMPQLGQNLRLDLRDSLIVELVGLTTRRAQDVRLKLKEAGVLWFPKWSKPKKKGDYPTWMVEIEFLEFVNEVKKKRVIKNSKYTAEYNKMVKEVRGAFYRTLKEELEEGDKLPTTEDFIKTSYRILDAKLATLGLTKADFLK